MKSDPARAVWPGRCYPPIAPTEGATGYWLPQRRTPGTVRLGRGNSSSMAARVRGKSNWSNGTWSRGRGGLGVGFGLGVGVAGRVGLREVEPVERHRGASQLHLALTLALTVTRTRTLTL